MHNPDPAPQLHVVDGIDSLLPRPPKHLSRRAKRWWRRIVDDYELEAHNLELLTSAAEALDRVHQAREILAEEGVVITDRFGQRKPHPAVSIELNNRVAFARLLREVGLSDIPDPDVRPPRRS